MRNLLLSLMPMGIFVGAILLIGIVLDWRAHKPKDRRSPLTRHLLRSPGHTLVLQTEELSWDVFATIMILSIMPALFWAVFISSRYYGASRPGDWAPYIYTAAAAGIVIYFSVKLRQILKKRNVLRLGLDCEMAVGQELNLLMLEGYHVFHDIPAEGFNIDHVVVGANGVFAVETKGRSKPNRRGGKKDATVTFDGESLKFPLSVEKQPLIQARRQATYLINGLPLPWRNRFRSVRCWPFRDGSSRERSGVTFCSSTGRTTGLSPLKRQRLNYPTNSSRGSVTDWKSSAGMSSRRPIRKR
jgi:hypothetical protein